ncbi:shikimate kinase [Cytobacillus sp. S13-E01]|uniref:shikimate kinase n=1 Tax=Cytobacillus sp. S13-E01 TaxID=3031326 RepID=UPI0023D7D2BC|nr:shikimate kinase [Cytobacillus sp. S13-E01]MDF0727785.1 shikimate kinase [Cytobacillus sp. S13-E01]
MKAIYLTGFMGAGKTTIGRELAGFLGCQVIDTDEYIEKDVGKKIRAIFEADGEATFRTYEREYLRKVPTTDVIVTTGGGLVIQEENREWMKKQGIVVYLHCELETILERLKHDTARPLIDHKQLESAKKLFNSRSKFYEEADIMIDTTSKTINETVDEIVKLVKSNRKWEE